MLDSFGMRSDNMQDYASALAAARPSVVVGYVSPLRALARWSLESGTALYQPKSVLSGAEALGPTDRSLFERAFRAPVFNTYGCREVMLIASECELHNLHSNADHLVVETTTFDGVPLVEESGQILLTDLHNYAMPLVRYVNSDMAVSSSRICPCGRGLPLLERIDGRILDEIRTPDGRLLPGEFFLHLFKDFLFIREFQVIQEALDSLKIIVVPNGEVSATTWSDVKKAIVGRTGNSLGIDIEIVADIVRTPSGKLRVTVSKLGNTLPPVR
jgi:phenylacetate-CoA ligase